VNITQLTVWRHELELKEPYSYAGTTLTAIPTVIVRLRTDNGLEGWGETCPLGATYQPAHADGAIAAIKEMGSVVLGGSALPRPLGVRMDGALNGHAYAKAALDIAAWDILGKSTGLPLNQLLGGALSDPVPSYYAIAPMSPDEAVRIAKDRVSEGYRDLQLKIGSGDLDRDCETIRQVYKAVPKSINIAADANRALLMEEAIHASRMLAGLSIALEQPCSTAEEMRALKGRLHHPLYWDESTTSPAVVMDALGQGFCDGLGMKLTRVGGITPMLGVRDMAAARGVKLSVDDSWGGDIIAAACVHVGATVPPKLFRGTWVCRPYLAGGYDPGGGIVVKDGHIDLPEKPGLGIEPDPALFGKPIMEMDS